MDTSPVDEFVPALLLDPTSSAFVQDPYSAYAQVRDRAPVVRVPGGPWIVTGSEQVLAVLRDTDGFTSSHNLDGDYPFAPEAERLLRQSQYYGRGMFNADPPDHGRLRGLLTDLFSPRSVRAMEPMIEAVARRLVGGFRADGRVDLVSRLALPLPIEVICAVLGVPAADQDRLRRWSQDWASLLVLPLPPQRQVECALGVVENDRYLRQLLAERFAEPREDAASVLAAAVFGPDPSCSIDEAVALLRGLVLAGHETTAGLIGTAVYHLLRTGTWAQLVADPGLIPVATEESLRFDPSAQSTSRMARRDVEVGGTVIPAGALVHPMTGAYGRDPDRIDAADEFRLDRGRALRHLAFGVGIHHCLGAALTRAEMKVTLSVLAAELPGLRLAAGATVEYQPGGFTFHALAGLPVEWD